MLRADDLTKRFGDVVALDGVSFTGAVAGAWALIHLGGRVYAGAILRRGRRVPLAEALRAGGPPTCST